MSDAFTQLLWTLRDVDGVIGSFIWTKSGNLIARDLPEPVDSAILCEIGPRIARLQEAFENSGDTVELTTLAFAQHKLHVRAIEHAFISVVSAVPVNMPMLKMALNLVGRRVSVELQQAAAAGLGEASSRPAESGTPTNGAWARIYRGNRVRD